MTIEIHDPELEALLRERMQAGNFSDPEQLLRYAFRGENGQTDSQRPTPGRSRLWELRQGIRLGDVSIRSLIQEERE